MQWLGHHLLKPNISITKSRPIPPHKNTRTDLPQVDTFLALRCSLSERFLDYLQTDQYCNVDINIYY